MESPRLYLACHLADGSSRQVPLRGGRVLVGRAADADIRLDSESVSRHHAEFVADPFNRWWVRDLGSRNGTILNGRKIREELLNPRDTIRLGNAHIEVHTHAQPATHRKSESRALRVADEPNVTITTLEAEISTAISAAHLAKILEFGQALAEIDNPQARAHLACELMTKEPFRGISAAILRVARENSGAQPIVVCGPVSTRRKGLAEPYVSRTVLQNVLRTGQPAMGSNVPANRGDVALSLSPEVMQIGAIACPVHSDDSCMDVLYVMLAAQLASPEWAALIALAARQYRLAEEAWATRQRMHYHAAIERDLGQARQIQQKLIPRELSIAGLEVAIQFEPSRWVGGDYVDVVKLTDGRVFLSIGDVCGKGLQAALVSSSIHTFIRASLYSGAGLVEVMSSLDEYLRDYLPEASFVTLIGIILNVASGVAQYVNAGHPPILLIDKGGAARELRGEQLPLGIERQAIAAGRLELGPGQILALVSDGWTELRDESGEMLGIGGFARRLGATLTTSAELKGLVGQLSDSVRVGGDAQFAADDRTLLLARRV